MSPSLSDLQTALSGHVEPLTQKPLADFVSLEQESLVVTAGYPTVSMSSQLMAVVSEALASSGIDIPGEVRQQIPAVQPANTPSRIDGVKNIIAVASGKGGVGKSTTSVNLALALAYEGARVGILDADIYGPSLPQMLGTGSLRPEVIADNVIAPLEAYGVQMVSMGSLVTENTPMVWRGPMVSGALKQLLTSARWQDLDYLIIDMPPGTGDIQLTLSQSVPVRSSVVVTTPQDIALLDAKKGIEMFRKVNIPVAGVVENMSTHICSQCGHSEAIFGEHGGERLAEEFMVPLLGQLPLKMSIREQVDAGKPPVVSDPESAESQEYRNIALKLAASLWSQSLEGQAGPEISFSDD